MLIVICSVFSSDLHVCQPLIANSKTLNLIRWRWEEKKNVTTTEFQLELTNNRWLDNKTETRTNSRATHSAKQNVSRTARRTTANETNVLSMCARKPFICVCLLASRIRFKRFHTNKMCELNGRALKACKRRRGTEWKRATRERERAKTQLSMVQIIARSIYDRRQCVSKTAQENV